MEGLLDWVSRAFEGQLAQTTFLFCLAAMVHARQVKKEIATQMNSIRGAIENVAKVLGEDLKLQSERLNQVEEGFHKLTSRVSELEKK